MKTARGGRFEGRGLGGSGGGTAYFDDSIPSGKPLAKLGGAAGPMQNPNGWRCVTAVEPAPAQSGVGAVVHLEPIDCFRRERDFDEEVVALRKAGWEEVIDGRARRGRA